MGDDIEIMTRGKLDAAAAESMAPGDNVLGLNPACEGAAFNVAYHPETATLVLTCSECDKPTVAVAVGDPPQPTDDGAGLICLGRHAEGDIPPAQADLTSRAVKKHLTALHTLPDEIRANVVASIMISVLMLYADPVDALAHLTAQVGARIPDMLQARALLDSEPEGRA